MFKARWNGLQIVAVKQLRDTSDDNAKLNFLREVYPSIKLGSGHQTCIWIQSGCRHLHHAFVWQTLLQRMQAVATGNDVQEAVLPYSALALRHIPTLICCERSECNEMRL